MSFSKTRAGFFIVAALWSGSAVASPEAKALLADKGCGACHVIPGVKGAYGKMGPSLKNVNERGRIGAGALENSPENMKRWLQNPKKVNQGTLMPVPGFTDAEIDIVLQYFEKI
ncbi:MAG: c-type cytochrome [Burkholderiaceae bacterium]